MKVFKTLVLFMVILLLATPIFAQGAAESQKMKIGFSISDLSNPVWVEMYNRMKEKADELGVQLVVNDAKNDPNSQINAIENFVVSGCKAIIVHAFDLESSKAAIDDAMRQGVKIISYDVDVEGTNGYVGVDNYALGMLIGEQAGKFINEELGGVAQVGLCEYPRISIIIERANGIIDGLKMTAPNAEIVARATAGYVNEGVSVGENFLQAFPNMEVVVGINDGGILGVYEAFKAAGKTGDNIGLFGCDATIDALNAIAENDIFRSTIQLDTVGSGAVMVEMAYKAALNEFDQKQSFMMKMASVNYSNIDNFIK